MRVKFQPAGIGTFDADVDIQAASMKGLVTAGAGDASQLSESRELATNKINIDFMAFDKDTEEHAYFWFTFPRGWNEGTITAFFYWTAASGSASETVDWGLAMGAFGNDDALDAALGTEVTTTDTLLATDDMHRSGVSGAVTIGGTPAEGDRVYGVVARKVASDNLAADAQLLSVTIVFTRDGVGDP